jgi:hypothetical protein
MHTIRSFHFFSGGVIIGHSGLEAAVRTLRYTTQVLSLWPSGLHIMHDAYTKMPFPPYPLTLTIICVIPQKATRLEKTQQEGKKWKKRAALKEFDRWRSRLSSLPWRFPSSHSRPSIKKHKSAQSRTSPVDAHPEMPISALQSGPKISHLSGNLISALSGQVRNNTYATPHKLRPAPGCTAHCKCPNDSVSFFAVSYV